MGFKENKGEGPEETPLHPSHPDYQAQQARLNKPQPAQSKQSSFIKEIRSRIDSYYNLVLRSIRDIVPKQVGYFLVQRAQDKLSQDLWHRINKNERISQ